MASIQAGNHRITTCRAFPTQANARRAKRHAAYIAARVTALLIMAGLGVALTGCTAWQDAGDYLNLRNSFLNAAEVGRFDKANPFGEVKPVKWPILDQLDVIEDSSNRWANATDPTPADLVPEVKEYVLGNGDAVQVSIYELMAASTEYVKQIRVNELGYLNIQNVGSIQVAGLTPTQVEQRIAQILIDQHILPATPAPQVSVSLLDSRARVFSVLGSAARPGSYNVLSGDFKLLDALALAGDIPVQPGMDYLYVIRQTPFTAATQPAAGNPSPTSVTPTVTPEGPTTAPAKNPLDILEQIEHGETQPSSGPAGTGPVGPVPAAPTGTSPAAPTTTQTGLAPQRVGPLPMAVVLSNGTPSGTLLAQTPAAELDAALGVPAATATASAPATTAAIPATATAPASAPAVPTTDQSLLTQAVGPAPQYVYIDGKWVPLAGSATGPAMTQPPTTGTVAAGTSPSTIPGTMAGTAPTTSIAIGTLPGIAAGPATMASATSTGPATTEALQQQRVIRIPISSLREGVSKYNIVIRPGDIVNIPPVEPGEFYLMGNVARPGVYSLTGRKITLKMAIAAGGNLGPLAVPRRCELIRRIGADQEAIVQVNLQAIFDGEQPDIFMKSNDVLNVGTDAIQPFLAVMRNAYRASYGWGFVYDRNFGPQQGG